MEKAEDDSRQWYEVNEADTIKGMMEISTRLYAEKPAYKTKEKKGAPYTDISYLEFREERK